ncbi:MAG: RlmE family RNA methyltransferase [Candidatus Caldarchaeum sp.]|nr:RlmE family RNA methyltransferase [Candidatus Caldarchaeum sp.]MDW7977805.1 RlmE family RNA methyltransferase [Candidatus Caldarchaeum sp.]MDW8359985.1 RlmE family RNA methyltransferase [Candidatus Caldarchaeum sp.]
MTREQWLQRRSEDPYWRMAKEMGLPSRAAFKLEEVQRRWRVIPEGGRVLDLGAAPGGMTAVASDVVGEKGLVVAVDVEPLKLQRPNVVFIQADVMEHRLVRELQRIVKDGLFDTVVSDLSPHHSGDYDLLILQHADLLSRSREIAYMFLKRRGNMVLKAFEHPALRQFEQETARSFLKFERYIPKSTKKGSSEVFLIFLGFKPKPSERDSGGRLSSHPLGLRV